MIVYCPKCNKELKLPDDAFGCKLQCCYCNVEFIIDVKQSDDCDEFKKELRIVSPCGENTDGVMPSPIFETLRENNDGTFTAVLQVFSENVRDANGRWALKLKDVLGGKDIQQVLRLEEYKKKALQGDAQSQYKLGLYYYAGYERFIGSHRKNLKDALKWLEMAASQGHKEAKNLCIVLKNERALVEALINVVGEKAANAFLAKKIVTSSTQTKQQVSIQEATKAPMASVAADRKASSRLSQIEQKPVSPRMTTPKVSSKAKNGQSSKSRMRFFTHPHDNNKIIATWDLDADKIKMYRGATTEFFFRAVCGYRAWKYAKSESLAGRSALMQKLLKLAETVPVGLKSRIVGKYSDSSPDTIIGETFLYAFGCSGRNSIEELLRSAEDMEWYNRYCQAIKEALAGAAARDMGIYLGSVDELAKIAPDDFVRMFIRRVSESDKAKKQEKPKPKEIKPLGRGEPNEFGIWAQKIAVDHLDDLFAKYNARVSDQFCQFRWIKKDRTSQSFEHFAFAYKNAVFAVLVNVVCGENAIAAMCGTKSMLSSDGQQRLCRESLRYNLVPCILDVVLSETDNEYTLQIADNKGWGLRHAKTGALIDPFEFGKNADTPMSDWELQNFAIVVAKNAFKGESVVDSYCDIPEAAPSMWFHDKAGHKAWAIVRFQRVLDESAANDYRDFVKKNPHLSSYDGFFIPVSAAVADAVLKDRNGHVIPLSKRFDGTAPIYRGHGLYVNFKRIIKIHNAEMQGAKKTGEGFFASFKKCVAKLLRRKQSTVTIICGAVMAATEELVCKDILKMKTSISSRLQMPSVKQYIAGALLNVISYTSSKSKQTCAFDGNKFMQALSQKYGKFCKIGYAQTEEMARELERTGAPTLSIAANYPIVARCIVAEIVIQGFLQRKIPTDEFDVFRREFLSVAESLWSDISSRQNVCRL